MAKNAKLYTAKAAKNDEFYTQLSDIENELKHYEKLFNGKIVYCNCETSAKGRKSNFWLYFVENFKTLGLKRLIATLYNENGQGTFRSYNGDKIENTTLKGDGDFRSEECTELLKQADIVVTNPPFSLFRKYVAQLMEYGKQFLIIGNMNAIAYKEIFPLIKENRIWAGVSTFNQDVYFEVPESYEYSKTYKFRRECNGKRVMRVGGICWFTNLEHSMRHEPLCLCQKKISEYPKYDNYDAIEVSKVDEIPADYDGIMGVPITFIKKYCPEQFEILGLMSGTKADDFVNGNDGRIKFYVNNKGIYARILVRKK